MSKLPTQTDVFVAGGGPAGLAAAIALRQQGLEVTLADCARPPIDKACGEGIMPDGLAALGRLGIAIAPQSAASFRGIRFLDAHNQVEADFSHDVGYGIRRTVLHTIMVERARQMGAALHWGARITGLSSGTIHLDGQSVRYRWLVCADGQNSSTRRMAGLDRSRLTSRRFGFRRHYRITPWSVHVEVHWSDCGQMYITPIAEDEICVALITRNPHLRFEQAFRHFPALAARLDGVTPERDYLGALTTTRCFSAVHAGNIALLGEASGSVDAITGEGLSLALQQATALAEAIKANNLRRYSAEHRRMARIPRTMSSLMLAMDRHSSLRRRALQALSADPSCFQHMLAVHTGAGSFRDFGVGRGLSLAWKLVAA